MTETHGSGQWRHRGPDQDAAPLLFGVLGSEYDRISWVGKDLRGSQSNLLVMSGAALGSDQVMQGFVQLGLEES